MRVEMYFLSRFYYPVSRHATRSIAMEIIRIVNGRNGDDLLALATQPSGGTISKIFACVLAQSKSDRGIKRGGNGEEWTRFDTLCVVSRQCVETSTRYRCCVSIGDAAVVIEVLIKEKTYRAILNYDGANVSVHLPIVFAITPH